MGAKGAPKASLGRPSRAPFGPLPTPRAVLGPFGDFLENLDFGLPSRPQTPSDLVFVLGANKSFSKSHRLKHFLINLLINVL